ncbi:MAG: hypothetical protein GY711_20005 [bacterium]|nr:hypothetical protein [bacterium]
MFRSLIAVPLLIPALAASPEPIRDPLGLAAPSTTVAAAQGRGDKKPKSELDEIRRKLQQQRKFITNRRKFFEANPVVPAGGARRGGADEREPEGRPIRLQFADEAQQTAWYERADYNRNSWLSYRECEAALKFTRPRFLVFDEDHDGRIAREEFNKYYIDAVRRNTFTEPKAMRTRTEAPRRSPEQLRNAYDFDRDSVLSLAEVSTILADYGAEPTPERAMGALDQDKNGLLTIVELGDLPSLLFPVALPPEVADREPEDRRPKTILDLLGSVELRGGTNPSPPRIGGPVPHFRRLDLDNDGVISVSDLENLLRPLHVRVRIPTLVNTLDTNRDGVLQREELMTALGADED